MTQPCHSEIAISTSYFQCTELSNKQGVYLFMLLSISMCQYDDYKAARLVKQAMHGVAVHGLFDQSCCFTVVDGELVV